MFFSPVPEKEIPDFITHGSIIQVFTVVSTQQFSYLPCFPLQGCVPTDRKYLYILQKGPLAGWNKEQVGSHYGAVN